MAIANIGDMLSRAGLRVLMIDFDLEAPGLELFFQIDHQSVREHLGLLDLLLSYKHDMSHAAPDDTQPPFRRLRELFVFPVYPNLPSGGRLDLLNAGRREGEERLSRYALNLRTFDWQDFYFNWAGELFFDWLRKTMVPELYDVVLVDSRTGVTEMGGICAYQLADGVVMFCAANQQNLQGTLSVVQNFFSQRVQALRHGRPLQVLAVPARIEQYDARLLDNFRERFESAFEPYISPQLRSAGMTFWDLMIPYDRRFSFQEQVVARLPVPKERQEVASAYEKLVQAMILIAEPSSALVQLSNSKTVENAKTEARYDITQLTAGYDVFLSYSVENRNAAIQLVIILRSAGLAVFDVGILGEGDEVQLALQKALRQSRAIAILIGSTNSANAWQQRELYEQINSQPGLKIVAVLLPGAELSQLSGPLAGLQYVDLRAGFNDRRAIVALINSLQGQYGRIQEDIVPYPGLRNFDEQHVQLFFGRDRNVAELLRLATTNNFIAIVGPSGSGKSSLVMAGLIPKLRQTNPGWRVSILSLYSRPLEALASATSALIGTDVKAFEAELASNPRALLSVVEELGIRQSGSRWVLVIDQFEQLLTLSSSSDERDVFLRVISQLSEVVDNGLLIIIILRADFFGEALRDRRLSVLLTQNNVYAVANMSREELREAIEKPARAAGLAFEPGLVDAILDDVGDEPNGLPLLQVVLSALWQRRRAGFLTLESYAEVGGVRGVLGYGAEQIFANLSSAEQIVARDVLLRLVQPTDVGATRRKARIDDLEQLGRGTNVSEVINKLINARLLAVSYDKGVSNCEIAHDGLVLLWPRLRGWIDESRELLLMQHELSDRAHEWDALGRDAGMLYRGLRLERAGEMIEAHLESITALERDFFEQSVALNREEEERHLEQARRTNYIIRLRRIAIGAFIAGVGAFFLGIGVGLYLH